MKTRLRSLPKVIPGLALLLVGLMPGLTGCGSNKPYPRLARGYVDLNQDGVRQVDEYIDPDTELFTASDTIVIVTRLKTDRTGGTLRLLVWGPDNQQIVTRRSTSVRTSRQTVQYRFSAASYLDLAGPGTYLVNWRLEDDTIESYSFEVVDDRDPADESDVPAAERATPPPPDPAFDALLDDG